jgi:hypothetical protein
MTKQSIASAEASLNAAPPRIATWLSATFRPSVAGYEQLAQRSEASRRSVYIWMLVSALIGGILASLDPLLAPLVQAQAFDAGLLVAIPLYALLVTLLWALFAGCAQGVARLLKGTGTYSQLAYASAMFSAPLMLIASALASIPWSAVPALILYGYWLVLYAVALQAVNQFSRLKAFAAILSSLLVCGAVLLGVLLLVVY